jgi:hypothetical protein
MHGQLVKSAVLTANLHSLEVVAEGALAIRSDQIAVAGYMFVFVYSGSE